MNNPRIYSITIIFKIKTCAVKYSVSRNVASERTKGQLSDVVAEPSKLPTLVCIAICNVLTNHENSQRPGNEEKN
jgi:hypothetical protein